MLLHCTQAPAKKIKKSSFTTEIEPGWNSWHAHMVRLDRRQCLFFCHDVTRYVLFLPGVRAEHYAELDKWHRELFSASLANEGVADSVIKQAELRLGPMRVDTKTDRSVLGSLRIVIQDLQFGWLPRVPNVLTLDPLHVAKKLNDRPTTVYGKWLWPIKAMKATLEGNDVAFDRS
jgi:hypothetical protein